MPKRRQGSSQRLNFAWNLIGTGLYNLSQWLLIVALARLEGTAEVGHFTLILALTAPVFLGVGMNLRVVLATDAAGLWRMADLFGLQRILNAVAAVCVVTGVLVGLRGDTLAALAVVTVAKAIEARSQVYYGYFQRHGRFDGIARSLVARAIAGPTAFLGLLLLFNSLTGAAAGLAVARRPR